MSEESPKITAIKKEKDPKRVEAGKRLAAIFDFVVTSLFSTFSPWFFAYSFMCFFCIFF